MKKRSRTDRTGFIKDSNVQKRHSSSAPVDDTNPHADPENANPDLDLDRLEKMWAKYYHEKPNDAREQLFNELHGVSSREVSETPELIASALFSFQNAIDNRVPELEKGAYYKGCSMGSTYIQSISFRLKFLRAELFDPEKAALRYVRNLSYLLEDFGEYALLRQLYLSDLDKDEMKFFKKGYMQILPFRDSVGRRIIVNLGSYGGLDFSLRTKERVGAYLNFSVLAEDETSQRKGAISIGLLNEQAIESSLSVNVSNFRRFVEAMPIRFTGTHTCLPDTLRSRILKALMLRFVQGDVRLMTRVHIGTQVECDYNLRPFGIPTEHIPRSCTGTIKDTYHKAFLKMRHIIDNHRKAGDNDDYIRYYDPRFIASPFPAIECPEVDSFLVRKNGVAWNYPGNIRVRTFLEEKLGNHKRLKGEYVTGITEEVMALGIPILVFDESHCWYTRVTKKEDIQRQLLHTMREIRKRNRIKDSESSEPIGPATNTFQGLANQRCVEMDSCMPCSNDETKDFRNRP